MRRVSAQGMWPAIAYMVISASILSLLYSHYENLASVSKSYKL
jgi:hypothetical protein